MHVQIYIKDIIDYNFIKTKNVTLINLLAKLI